MIVKFALLLLLKFNDTLKHTTSKSLTKHPALNFFLFNIILTNIKYKEAVYKDSNWNGSVQYSSIVIPLSNSICWCNTRQVKSTVFFVHVKWFYNNSNADSWHCSLTGKQSNYFNVWSIFLWLCKMTFCIKHLEKIIGKSFFCTVFKWTNLKWTTADIFTLNNS